MRVSAVAFARFVHTLTQLRLGSKAAKPAQPSPPRGEGKARDKPRDTAGQTHIAALFQAYRGGGPSRDIRRRRSEEHTSELQSLMRISYAVFCLKKKIKNNKNK